MLQLHSGNPTYLSINAESDKENAACKVDGFANASGLSAVAVQAAGGTVLAHCKNSQPWVSGISLDPFRSGLQTTPKVTHVFTPHPVHEGLRECPGGTDASTDELLRN